MEFFGALLGLSILAQILVAIVAGLLFPAFWVWMLVDAIVRDAGRFPSGDNVEKIVWIVVLLTLHPVAILYFFLVWRQASGKAVGTSTPQPSPAAGVPAAPTTA